MGSRYYITGVQIGMLKAYYKLLLDAAYYESLLDVQRKEKIQELYDRAQDLLDEICEKQNIYNSDQFSIKSMLSKDAFIVPENKQEKNGK